MYDVSRMALLKRLCCKKKYIYISIYTRAVGYKTMVAGGSSTRRGQRSLKADIGALRAATDQHSGGPEHGGHTSVKADVTSYSLYLCIHVYDKFKRCNIASLFFIYVLYLCCCCCCYLMFGR